MSMKRGFGLLEVVVGIAILGTSFYALLALSRYVLVVSAETTRGLQADFLLEEGVEAVRAIRDSFGYTPTRTLIGSPPPTPPIVTGYISFSTTTSSWAANITTPEVIDGTFWRIGQLLPVYRDPANDNIVPSTTPGSAQDVNTGQLNVIVSWHTNAGTTTRSISTYLTNYFND
jgi:prepilin-type N-terminal cleavage/methylation domain-containing protein